MVVISGFIWDIVRFRRDIVFVSWDIVFLFPDIVKAVIADS